MSPRHRLAAVLCGLAARLLPPAERAWSAAMQRELKEMDEPEALAWAVGCLCAALHQRRADVVRIAVAGAALLLGLNNLSASVALTIRRLAGAALEAGDAKLILLMQNTPAARLGLWLTVDLLFLAAALALFRRWLLGPVLFLAGFGAWLVQTVDFHSEAAYRTLFPSWLFAADYGLFCGIALASAAVIWLKAENRGAAA